ncbi:MAG: multiprotein bridging factor aMBF1 [Promethearchaeota archaeon]
MSKKTGYRKGNECPICGGIIWGKPKVVLIEGTKMQVCQACAQYGTKIKSSPPIQPKKTITTPKIRVKKSTLPKKPKFKIPDTLEDLELVSDYAERIRNTRLKLKLNQEQFANKIHEKVSLIKRIEGGKAKPTLKLAKKIEDTYGIKLLQKSDEIEVNYKSYLKKKGGTSLGDIAFIKKKK